MRKRFTLLIALMALCVSSWATVTQQQIGSFYYELDDATHTATLIKNPYAAESWQSYDVYSDLVISATVNDGVADYTVTTIGESAFQNGGMPSLVIEEGVVNIADNAFWACSNLKKATLPSTIESIGDYAFQYSGLTKININATTPPTLGYYVFENASSLAHIYVPSASVTTYKGTSGWSDYASIIDVAPVSVEWNQAKVASVNVWCSNGDDPASQTVDGITITATAPAGGDYSQFNTYSNNSSIYIENGGTMTFAPTSGKLKSIVIECGDKDNLSNLVAESGWTWNSTGTYSGQLIWTSATEAGASSVVLACSGESLSFYSITSAEFIFAAEEPAPAVTTTTITWDQTDVESLSLAPSNVDDVANSEEIDGITASLTRTSVGQYDYCQINGDRNLWITNSCGYLTFTSTVGDISHIVITCEDNYSYHSISDLSSDWTYDSEALTLTWDGTASDEVSLLANMDVKVSSIEFTVTSSSSSSEPVSQGPVTWDFANDAELASISLTEFENYYFSYNSSYGSYHGGPNAIDLKDIVATISATTDGAYASFSDNNNNSITLEAGGTLTFSTTLGQFQSIVVNTNNGSGRSSNGWAWDLTEHTLTWAGTPANSVVMDDIFVDEITSIVFTFASASADPEPETIPGPSFKWEQRQVNHVDLIGNNVGDPETAPVIKNIITSLTPTGGTGNCYFGHWGEKGKLNVNNCGDLKFKSLVGNLRAIVITCSNVTAAGPLPADWTYDDVAGTLTWKGTTASSEVTLSGYLNIDIAEIEFYYTPASAPRLGETFYDAGYQLYEITGAQTAKVAYQPSLSHTLDIPASVEDGGVTYYITEIDDYAFQNDLDLPNVMGGENIGIVGAHAFDGCHRIDEIDIESEVLDEIGEAAFAGCKLMQDIGFYTEQPPVLGTDAFADTRYLNHIIVPSGNLTDYQTAWSTYAAKISPSGSSPQVDDQFFYHNQTTTNIYAVLSTSPKEAKVLPYTAEVNAIYPITRTGTLVIPEEAYYIHNMYTITGIGANAYKDSTRFTTVMMPEAVKLIEEGAFRNCTGVEKVYFLWDDPTEVTWADANQGLDFATAASGNTKIFVPENRLAEYQDWAPAWASCMIGADILDITASQDPKNNIRYYRTFYDSQADYLMPPSVWAHAGYVDGSGFILHSVAYDGEILPRGTAVVLESETPTYRLIPVGNDAPAYTGRNDLRGTDVAIPTNSVGNNGENVYVLNKQYKIGDDLRVGMGMYKYTGTTLGAHKAYMILDNPPASGAPARFLFRHEEDAQNVKNVQSGNAQCAKVLRDGQLIIIKDGKEYNAQGLIIK